RASVDVFERADAKVVEHAVSAAAALPALADCADTTALLSPIAPPAPADAPQVEAIRRRLDEVGALKRAGKYADALAEAEAALTDVKALGYVPLLSEAELEIGTIRVSLEQPSDEAFFESIWASEAAHDDKTQAAAWIQLVGILGGLDRPREGHRAAKH